MPAAATKLRDLPAGAIPYISATDLVVFKMNSCGKKRTDVADAQALLERLTVHASLNLTDTQRAIVEPCIKDVVAQGTKSKEWWSERLGLPASRWLRLLAVLLEMVLDSPAARVSFWFVVEFCIHECKEDGVG
jgi:hypothetical protein